MNAIPLTAGISMLSGSYFDYLNPDECPLTIDDIATPLSNICRFAGHLPRFYSVAQHVVNCSYIVSPAFAFDALMHDTAEAFTNDLPTPLKTALPIFKELEVKIESAMSRRFGFTYPLAPEVKLADAQMLGLEATYVKELKEKWAVLDGIEYEHLKDMPGVDLTSWTPRQAKANFIRRYQELRP
jgi:5'-deoxynucleotidase YfbR-like HD superfamily hydrolase